MTFHFLLFFFLFLFFFTSIISFFLSRFLLSSHSRDERMTFHFLLFFFLFLFFFFTLFLFLLRVIFPVDNVHVGFTQVNAAASERRAQNHPGNRTGNGVGGKVLGQSAHQKRAADEDRAQTERVQNALFLR